MKEKEMFFTSVSYEDAVKWHKKFRLRQKIKVRLKGGKLYRDVAYRGREFIKYRSKQTFKELLRDILIFVLGGRIVNFFGKRSFTEEKERIIRMFVPQENQILYHWTSLEFVEEIQKKGLVPGKAHQYVYLTDDPKYMEDYGFLYGKTKLYGRDTTYVALEIMAEKLLKREKIYQIADAHEFVAKSVPTECISLIEEVDGETP